MASIRLLRASRKLSVEEEGTRVVPPLPPLVTVTVPSEEDEVVSHSFRETLLGMAIPAREP